MNARIPLDSRPWENIPWVQREINQWATATFGKDRTAYMALAKMVLEEIPEMLEHQRNGDVADIGQEVADVAILLFDIAEMWGVDLSQAIQTKMAINYNRTWARAKDSLTYQHTKENI